MTAAPPEAPPYPETADGTAFAARLSAEVNRHPTRLVAACLASVLGPAMVAHAGLSSEPRPAAAVSEVVAEPPGAPVPGDVPSWEAAARAAADTCPGLPATVLVAIGRVESSLGLQPWPSSAGAEGPMQFLPRTWAAYGADGDRDGRADVTNPTDALHGAARLLCANGAGDGRLRSALWNYNHSDAYVDRVLALAGA